MINEIAHIIGTFERPGVCQRLVDSINRRWGEDSHIYVCDDSRQPHKYKGCKNIKAPSYDIGLSAKRNLLVQRTEEPYIFIWDDDIVAYEETNLEMFYHTLKNLDDVGIVAGEWFLENYQRDRWFCGPLTPVGGEVRLTPPENRPSVVETDIGEIRYHRVACASNWLLARRDTLETVPWDEELKLNEHMEYFCRLSAVRNETENDKKWRERYLKLAAGEPLREVDEDDKIAVYTMTTFLDRKRLPDGMTRVQKGNWIKMTREDAKLLSEKGYVAHLENFADTRPFYPKQETGVPLGVAMIPDNVCYHARYESKNDTYDEGRERQGKFIPLQKAKIGVKERKHKQWGKYPYGQPDFNIPPDHVVEQSHEYNSYAKD